VVAFLMERSFLMGHGSGSSRSSASALVVVLCFLVIISGLVLAFFSGVTGGESLLRAETGSLEAGNLADSVSDLVISQIRDGTCGYARGSDGSLDTNTPLCWASQPGMIRTYNISASTAACWKLYSSPTPVVRGPFLPENDLPPAGWSGSPALYVDLNMPVVSSSGTNYPIVDPTLTNRVNGIAIVDGFSISNAPVLSGATNPAAMPVSWIYVLRDGTLVAPERGGTTKATFSGQNLPSAGNPIVGRIAYWTDDETCKLNLNTAGEGTPWFSPNFSTSLDVAFGRFPPAPGEFDRIPGHPATTSLSPVLWSFLGLSHPAEFLGGFPAVAGVTTYDASGGSMSPLFAGSPVPVALSNTLSVISPNYGWGGSLGGTASVLNGGSPQPAISSNPPYATVDELAYPSGLSSSSRSVPSGPVRPSDAARLGFFLTVSSKAPDLNPFNRPRIAMWPVPDATHAMVANPSAAPAGSNRSPGDRKIALASTIGTNAYYFTRYDATSATNDFSGRNRTLYNYLRRQMDTPVPGFLGAFSSSEKWSGGSTSLQADQICTLVFDYIRSCINLADSTSGSSTNLTQSSFSYAYTTPPVLQGTNPVPQMTNGSGQVVPIRITNPDGKVTGGIGRFPTLAGASLWFIARGANQPPLMCHPNGRPMMYDSSGTTLLSASDGTPSGWAGLILTLIGQTKAKVNPQHPWTCPPSGSLVPQLMTNITLLFFQVPVPVLASVNTFTPSSTNVIPDLRQLFPVYDLSAANTPGTPPTRAYPALDANAGQFVTIGSPSKNYISSTNFTLNYPMVLAMNSTLTSASGFNSRVTPGPVSGIVTHPGLRFLPVQRPTGATAGAFDILNPLYADLGDNLAVGQTRVEAAYIPDLVNVSPGETGLLPSLSVAVTGLTSFRINSNAMSFPLVAGFTSSNTPSGIAMNPQDCWLSDPGLRIYLSAATNTLFSTNLLVVSGSTFGFGGGTVSHTVLTGGNPVRMVTMAFPDGTFPTPKLPPFYRTASLLNYPPLLSVTSGGFGSSDSGYTTGDLPSKAALTFNKADPVLGGVHTRLEANLGDGLQSYVFPTELGASETNSSDPSWPWQAAGLNRITSDTVRSVGVICGDPRMIAPLTSIPSGFFAPHPLYYASNPVTVSGWPTYVRSAHSLRSGGVPLNGYLGGTLVGTNASWSATSGNFQNYPPMTASPLAVSLYGPVQGVGGGLTNFFGHAGPRGTDSDFLPEGHTSLPHVSAECDFTQQDFFNVWLAGGDFDNGPGYYSDGPFINKADDGFGSLQAGQAFSRNPWFAADLQPVGAGMAPPSRIVPSPGILGSLPVGFAGMGDSASPDPNMLSQSWLTLQFSPNPNAVSTSARDSRSLLAGFNNAGGIITNPILPDHLLLDFFRMPVVDPRPLSDAFSTAGKVNMNARIAPFSYIRRETALRGALKSVMITAVDEKWGPDYKLRNTNGFGTASSTFYADSTARTAGTSYNDFGSASGNFYFHYPVHAGETLKQFDQRFSSGDLFHSPSEICSLWLYPALQPSIADPSSSTIPVVTWDSASANIKSWWYGSPGTARKGLTGDNVRERPYVHLYPRLTTQSDTYTVHFRVQSLRQVSVGRKSSADWSVWNESSDKVDGEERGSRTIERTIDPTDPTLPDFAGLKDAFGTTVSASDPVLMPDKYYRYRVISSKSVPR